jgi:glycosyltransferase involved in cell wall biosynthesis
MDGPLLQKPLLRVCLFATFDPRNWSGGRYHALMLAAATAYAGFETHIVADHRPAFADELGLLCANSWEFHLTEDFQSELPAGPFDFVILVPTGIFLPDFYESAMQFARQAMARLVLLNFESANWFNQVAPKPKDKRLWEYWQRVCLDGGVVLSSTRTSDAMARRFYGADKSQPLHFEVWHPPVNSPACRSWNDAPAEGAIVVCVRPTDAHKGAADILAIDPDIVAGRRIDIIAGTDLAQGFQDNISEHLGSAPGVELVIHTRIPDRQKFRLFNGAQALLFPSKFEGYGYPPVEAAFAGAEIVCYDLPVLRETVGTIAHFATSGQLPSLEAALAAALAAPPRRAALRAAVEPFAAFERAAPLLGDILLRSWEATRPLPRRNCRAAWAPWDGAKPNQAAPWLMARDGYLPPAVISAKLRGGSVFITVRVSTRGPLTAVDSDRGESYFAAPPPRALPPAAAWVRADVHIVIPAEACDTPMRLGFHGAAETVPAQHWFRIDEFDTNAPKLPTRSGITSVNQTDEAVIVEGWVLTANGANQLLLVTGEGALTPVPLTISRPDLAMWHPGYPKYRCGYVLSLPADAEPERGIVLLVIAGGQLEDALRGWPPQSGTVADEPFAVADDEPADAAPADGPPADAAPADAAPAGAITLLDIVDENCAAGVSRHGWPDRPGAILVARDGQAERLATGDHVRLPSGRLRQVVEVLPRDDALIVQLDLPVSTILDRGPCALALMRETPASRTGHGLRTIGRSDDSWHHGVWRVSDRRYRAGILFDPSAPAAAEVGPGALLVFAQSGLRRVVEAELTREGLRVWLDGEIVPFGDGAPLPVRLVRAADSGTDPQLLLSAETSARCTHGVVTRGGETRGRGALFSLPAPPLARGDMLEFAHSGRRQVLSVQRHDDAVEVRLDAAICAELDGYPNGVRRCGPAAGRSSRAFSVPAFTARDFAHVRLAQLARQDRRAIPAARPGRSHDRPRILFATPVPPLPANQGNRVVTRNLIDHLVGLGFDVDVVLQGSLDLAPAAMRWGPRVRFFLTAFPDWTETPAVRLRQDTLELIRRQKVPDADGFFAEAAEKLANAYHPLFIVRDETVDLAQALYRNHVYDYVVCNYTHMLRVPIELEAIEPLPPVVVITHDMLSRLEQQPGTPKLDTMYRACPPAIERAVLDQLPGAVIVAISQAERRGFEQIGVQNPVVVCEYDGFEELHGNQVQDASFDNQTLLFHGSGNPMNMAGLGWFFDHCWDQILARRPRTRLVICGLITARLPPALPNVVYRGDLLRTQLLRQMRDATIAINPCVAGTGLKIKTVESCCTGLPLVCLPLAVEGLEDVADQIGVVARNAAEFVDGCIALLEDRNRWRRLSDGALAVAAARFSRETVYRELDQAAGWAQAAPDRRMTPRGLAVPETPPPDPAAGRRDLEEAAISPASDAIASLHAATAALADGDGWSAAVHGAAACAQWPERAAGYRLVAQGMAQLARHGDAADSLFQALAAEPDNREVRAEFLAAAHKAGRPGEAFQQHPVLALPCAWEQVIELNRSTLGDSKPGWGWSGPEEFFTWTDGVAARLRLEFSAGTAPGAAGFAVFYGHVHSGAGAAPNLALAINGILAGAWTLAAGQAHILAAALPEGLAETGEIVLDFLIGEPAMAKADGKILDTRQLGLAIRWLKLTTQPPPDAFLATAG